MTEPEDLEEDLFADLYDGDENNAGVGAGASHATDITIPGADEPAADEEDEHTFDINQSDSFNNAAPISHDNNFHAQNGYSGKEGERFDTERAQQSRDMSVDQEHHGSGIKEDG